MVFSSGWPQSLGYYAQFRNLPWEIKLPRSSFFLAFLKGLLISAHQYFLSWWEVIPVSRRSQYLAFIKVLLCVRLSMYMTFHLSLTTGLWRKVGSFCSWWSWGLVRISDLPTQVQRGSCEASDQHPLQNLICCLLLDSWVLSSSSDYGFLVHRLCVLSRLVVSSSLQPPGLYPTRLLSPWSFPPRILDWVPISSSRGIFPTQESNPHLLRLLQLLHWQANSLPLCHLGSSMFLGYMNT